MLALAMLAFEPCIHLAYGMKVGSRLGGGHAAHSFQAKTSRLGSTTIGRWRTAGSKNLCSRIRAGFKFMLLHWIAPLTPA